MWLGQRRRRWVAAAAVAGIAGGLPVAAPAKADGVGVVSTTATSMTATSTTATSTTATSTTVQGATIVSVVPPNETKIVQASPVTTAPDAAPARPTPAGSAAPAAATAPAETAAGISADSPALEALVAVTGADQRRAVSAVAQSESGVAALRAAFDVAQGDLSARQADEEAARARLDAAETDLTAAEARVAAAALAASSAADAVAVARTPVASPPSRGHSPHDAVVQARADLAAATADRDGRRSTVADRQGELDAAQQASAAAGQVFTARADDLQGGLDALDQARQQLAGGGSGGGPGSTAAGAANLRPAPTALASATIPADYLALYGRAAATCPGLSWLVLAGIGSVESGHGQSGAAGVHSGANVAGAMGPMQFLAGTWASYGVDGDGDGVADVYNPADAIFGAANYLCASGAGDVSTLRRALFDYNHADWYVEEVLQIAARY